MSNLKHTGGDWKIRKTVDETGDYPFPTYDILAVFEYGPMFIGTANDHPYNAKMFASSPLMLGCLIDIIRWEKERFEATPWWGTKIRSVVELATGMTIEEVLK